MKYLINSLSSFFIKRDKLCICLISFIVIISVYSDVLMNFRSLDPYTIYSQVINETRFLNNESIGIGFPTSDNKFYSDYHVELATSAFFERGINGYIGNSIQNFILPIWNPYSSLGMPMIEQYSTRLFFPFQLLENLIIKSNDTSIFQIIRMMLISIFIIFSVPYVYGPINREYKINTSLVIILSSLICCSSVFTWFLGLEQLQNVFLSASILFYTSFKYGYDTKGGVLLNSISLALLHFSGQPEPAFFVIIYFAIVELIKKDFINLSLYFKNIFGFLISNFIALSICIFQIYPFLYGIYTGSLENNLHSFEGGSGMASPTPLTLLRLYLFPTLSSYPRPLEFYPINGHWDAVGFFIGLPIAYYITLSLIFSNFKNKYLIKLFLASFIYILVITFKNFGIPPFNYIGQLPFFNMVWSQRWSNVSLYLALFVMFIISYDSINTKIIITKSRILFFSLANLFLIYLIYDFFKIYPFDEFTHGQHYFGIDFFAYDSLVKVFLTSFILALLILICSFFVYLNLKKGKNINIDKITYFCSLLFLLCVTKQLNVDQIFFTVILVSLSLIFVLLRNNLKIYEYIIIVLLVTLLPTLFATSKTTLTPIQNNSKYIQEVILKTKTNNRVFIEGYEMYGNASAAQSVSSLSGIFSLPPSHLSAYLNNFEKNNLPKSYFAPWFASPMNYYTDFANVFLSSNNMNKQLLSNNSVEYLACISLNCDNFDYLMKIGPYNIYKNHDFIPRVHLLNSKNQIDFFVSQNQIDIYGCFNDGDTIIVRDIWYPGWRSSFGVNELETDKYEKIYRKILIKNKFCGNIIHEYSPIAFWYTFIIGIFTLLLILILFFLIRIRVLNK